MEANSLYELVELPYENDTITIRIGNESCFSLSGDRGASRMHSHPFSEITLITHGNAKCLYNSTAYQIGKGDLVIFDANSQHVIQGDADFNCLTVGLEGYSIKTATGEFIYKTQSNYEYINATLKKILEESKGKEEGYKKVILYLLSALNVNLSRILNFEKKSAVKENSEKKLNNGVFIAKNYIENNYNQNITLNKLCEIAYVSPQHLIRQFKTLTGFAPKQYLNRIRVRVAADAILDSFESIKNIAKNVGFEDYQAFLYTFKALVKETPQEFRERYKNDLINGRKKTAFF